MVTAHMPPFTNVDQKKDDDPVNNPSHYNQGSMEAIEAIEAMFKDPEHFKAYCEGTILKYLWRHKYKKKPIQDLEKAEWYLKLLLEKHGRIENGD